MKRQKTSTVYTYIYKLFTEEQEQFAKHHASTKPYICIIIIIIHSFITAPKITNDLDLWINDRKIHNDHNVLWQECCKEQVCHLLKQANTV